MQLSKEWHSPAPPTKCSRLDRYTANIDLIVNGDPCVVLVNGGNTVCINDSTNGSDCYSYQLEKFRGGMLAASVYHDENDDGKLNTGLFWRPKEGFAFSNEYEPKAMPKFSKAAIEVFNGENVMVRLNY
jgi:hypothetical protein